MIKRNSSLLLLLVLFLLNFFCVNVNTAETQNYIPRKVDIDRSVIPKNILLGSYIGGRSHVKPMLDIAAILIERVYNVRVFFYLLDVFLDRSSSKFLNFLHSRCIGNIVSSRKI